MKKLFLKLFTFSLMFVLVSPSVSHGEFASAVDFPDAVVSSSFPYTAPFILSAYYSPLPCQNRYVTGSYASDIRLNGGGVRGADGTAVYPGMIAAPKTYKFGTKMDIPGIGITAVHDRGGAIVSANVRNNQYDRLDIWMGYGDKGLNRAMQWGKRTLDVTVYGVDPSIREQVFLGDYSASEATPNDCNAVNTTSLATDTTVKEYVVDTKEVTSTDDFVDSLYSGLSGAEVARLQKKLSDLNLYRAEISGKFDNLTKHAVFKFQQSQNIVASADTAGAGVFGPQTKGRMNEILASTVHRNLMVATASINASSDTLN